MATTGRGSQVEMTPLGLLPSPGLAALRAFGEEAERLKYPCIGVGGFIVPGRDPAASNLPGIEGDNHVAVAGEGAQRWGTPPREEARPAAGARQRPQSAQAAPGTSTHSIGHGLTTLNLDLSGLVKYHPLARVVASTETVAYLNIPIGVFYELPIGARLTLEVPLLSRERLTSRLPLSSVPDVRAWAAWEGGPMHGRPVVGHHQYPDRAICANMPGQWIRSVHPLHDYVGFCVLWVAKVLHEHLFGFYPGPQHCSVAVRVRRDRSDEFCGCSQERRYRHCCREADLARTPYDRWKESQLGRLQYLSELARQGRVPEPPRELLRLGLVLG